MARCAARADSSDALRGSFHTLERYTASQLDLPAALLLCNAKKFQIGSRITLYASDLRMNKSPHVLTGANRSRGTTTAPASSKHSMAEPIAVSSWNTGVEDESLGLTVFLFLMRGRGRVPLDCDNVSFRLSRLTQRLLVLKNLCLQIAKGMLRSPGQIVLDKLSSCYHMKP